jgi:signal transduction protein with GAF and PtsI domain
VIAQEGEPALGWRGVSRRTAHPPAAVRISNRRQWPLR